MNMVQPEASRIRRFEVMVSRLAVMDAVLANQDYTQIEAFSLDKFVGLAYTQTIFDP